MAQLRAYLYKHGFYLRTVVEGHFVTYQVTPDGEEYLEAIGGLYDGYELEKWEIIEMVQDGYLTTGGSGVGEEVDDLYLPDRFWEGRITDTSEVATANTAASVLPRPSVESSMSSFDEPNSRELQDLETGPDARTEETTKYSAESESPKRDGSSTSDLIGNAQDVDDEPSIDSYDQRMQLSVGGRSSGSGNCIFWLITSAAVIAVALFGVFFTWILLFNNGPEPALTSTPVTTKISSAPEASRIPTFTPAPSATATPTATQTPSPTPTQTPTATPTPTPTPDVILLGMKALGQLNTVQYNLKTVVEKEVRQKPKIDVGPLKVWEPLLHFLLVAEGRIIAGVDFEEMVRYEIMDSKVTVYLPAPRITGFYLDPRSLKPYYIRKDLGLGEEFAVEKYNEAIVEAQESLKRAALDSDILLVSRKNTVALVQSLILGLGFSEVEVIFLPSAGNEVFELETPLETMPTLAPFPTATPEQ